MPPRLEFPELHLQARSACAPFWSGRTESRLVLPLDQHFLKSIAQPHITSRRLPHIGVQDGRGPRASLLLSSPWLDPYLDGESPPRLLRLFTRSAEYPQRRFAAEFAHDSWPHQRSEHSDSETIKNQ